MLSLTPPQQAVFEHGLLTSGFNTILQMPTGSGKTWLAEYAIEQTLTEGKRAIYLTPLRALAQELRTKGIDDEVAKQALEAIDPHLEEERARELVARKLPAMAGLDPLVQTRRLAGMLSRKGYSADLCLRIVREAVREAPEHQRD